MAGMAAMHDAFLHSNFPPGETMFMEHEGEQLAVALGVAKEDMDVIIENQVFLESRHLPGTVLTWGAILDDGAPPFKQVLWKDGPMNFTMVVHEKELGRVREVFGKLNSSELAIGAFDVLVLCDAEALLFEGGSRLYSALGLRAHTVSKVHRGVATTSGGHLYAWLFSTSQVSREVGGEPVYKVVRLLAPGTEPKRLFVDIKPPPQELWAVCVPTKNVGRLVATLGKTMDELVVLPGPVAGLTKWVLVRDVDTATMGSVEENLGVEEGSAFCPYEVFKGQLENCAVVAQVFWRRTVKTVEKMMVLWQTVQF